MLTQSFHPRVQFYDSLKHMIPCELRVRTFPEGHKLWKACLPQNKNRINLLMRHWKSLWVYELAWVHWVSVWKSGHGTKRNFVLHVLIVHVSMTLTLTVKHWALFCKCFLPATFVVSHHTHHIFAAVPWPAKNLEVLALLWAYFDMNVT